MGKPSLSERFRRLFIPTEELEATELREQAVDCGAQRVDCCAKRSKVRLRGTVTSVTCDTRPGWVEAQLTDGSGTVRLIWMGRSRIECLLPGHTVQVAGRLAECDGQPVIFNPEFQVLP